MQFNMFKYLRHNNAEPLDRHTKKKSVYVDHKTQKKYETHVRV